MAEAETNARDWINALVGGVASEYQRVLLAGVEWIIYIKDRDTDCKLSYHRESSEGLQIMSINKRAKDIEELGYSWEVNLRVNHFLDSEGHHSFYVRNKGYANSPEHAAKCALEFVGHVETINGVKWYSESNDRWVARIGEDSLSVRAAVGSSSSWKWERECKALIPLLSMLKGGFGEDIQGEAASREEACVQAGAAVDTFKRIALEIIGNEQFELGRQSAFAEIASHAQSLAYRSVGTKT